VPHIEMLKEDNVRQGFFEEIEFEAFRNHGEEARTQKGQEAFFPFLVTLKSCSRAQIWSQSGRFQCNGRLKGVENP
jgi:hypothetical protein